MRLPLAVSLTSRDGTLDKDPLITNGLIEGNKKVSVVRSRPGVTDLGLVAAGTARLLACWNGLLSVIGDSLSSLIITAVGTSDYVATSYGTSPVVSRISWYNGTLLVGCYDIDADSSQHYTITAGVASTLGAVDLFDVDGLPGTVATSTTLNSYTFFSDENASIGTGTNVYRVTTGGSFAPTNVRSYGGGTYCWGVFGDGTRVVAPFEHSDSGTPFWGTRIDWTIDGSTWGSYLLTGVLIRAATAVSGGWLFVGTVMDPGLPNTYHNYAPAVYFTADFVTFTSVYVSGFTGIPELVHVAYTNGYVYTLVGTSLYVSSNNGVTFSFWDTYAYLWQQDSNVYVAKGSAGSYELFSVTGNTFTSSGTVSSSLASFGGKGSALAGIDTGQAGLRLLLAAETEVVTPTPITTLIDAFLSSEATGASQSQQELMIKSSEKLWQYTVTGGLVLVTDIDYPGHHTYTASSVTRAGSTATFNTTVTNALESGMSVVVSGATQTEYNGTHTIASIVAGDTFTYTVTGTPATPATGTITVYGGKTTVPGIVFLDGYFFVMTDKGVIHNSDLGNGTSWNALNFVTAAEEPGGGVALGKSANYLVAFKEWSTEPFYDAGNATGSPISPVRSMSTRIGCASGTSLVDVDDKLIWISQTKDKGRSVHVMQGLQQQTPVATSDVERILELDDLASVSAYGLRIAGHVLYVLTLHTSAITLVCDLTSGVWYQWTSLTADTPLSVTSMTRSGTTVTVVTSTAHGRSDGDPVLFAGAGQSDYNGRFNVAVISSTSLSFQVDSSQATTATGTITATTYTEGHFAYTKHVYCSGRHLLLHESNGHLYEFTDEVASDALAPIDLHCRTGKVDNGNAESKRLALLEVVGHKTPNGLALVRWTDDDYTSWSTYRSVDLEQERSQLRRCGDFSRRAFELRYTGDAKVTLGALELDVKG